MGCASSTAKGRVQVPALPTYDVPPPQLLDIPGSAGFKSPTSLPQGCLGRKLGEGTYATVYSLRSRGLFESSPLPLAAKVIELRSAHNHHTLKYCYETALREADVWARVCGHDCEFLVSLVETFLDEHCVVFVMERCCTTLAQHIMNCPRFDEAIIAGLLSQMLYSLQHIHETLKIGDFGLAVTSSNIWEKGNAPHSSRNPSPAPRVAGTAPFMSPEMLSRVAYSTQTDIWSLGCMAYTMMIGQFPYMPKVLGARSMKEAIRAGHPAPSYEPGPDATFPNAPKGSYSGPGDETVAFLARTLSRDVTARPTAREALEHPYLSRKLSVEDSMQLPCLRNMFQRAACCGAFDVEQKPQAGKT